MSVNYQFNTEITNAFRNLVLGRVALKVDANAGDTTLIVKNVRQDGTIIPGDELFMNNTLLATMVQPTADDVPGSAGIEHSENVTISATTYATPTRTGDITLSAALTKDYDVSRGAYIRMRTLPSAVSTLNFIQNDFIPIMNMAPLDEWFPGVLVVNRGLLQTDDRGSVCYNFVYGIRVYVCDTLSNAVDNASLLIAKAEVIRDLILEDNYIGGTAHQCEFERMLPWYSTDAAQTNSKFLTATHGLEVGWVQIDFTVSRSEIWNKNYLPT